MVGFTFLEDRRGSLSWETLRAVVESAERSQSMSDAVRHTLKERLKTDVLPLVLNTLTALHTISLNCSPGVRDQIANTSQTKIMKHLERNLTKPAVPGVEAAVAQLLVDWSFLFSREEIGARSQALIGAPRLRQLVAPLRPTDVGVAERERRRVGMPRAEPFVPGYDFGVAYAHPLDGPCEASTTPVLAAFSRLVLLESAGGGGGGVAGAPLTAGLRGAVARAEEPPRVVAERILSRVGAVRADVSALAAAQRAASQAARDAGGGGGSDTDLLLSRALDAAYAAAARCDGWRQQVAAAVKGENGDPGGGAAAAGAYGAYGAALHQSLPSEQLSALLSLADELNGALDGWQRCSRGEVWSLLGVDARGAAAAGVGSVDGGAGAPRDGRVAQRQPSASPAPAAVSSPGPSAAPQSPAPPPPQAQAQALAPTAGAGAAADGVPRPSSLASQPPPLAPGTSGHLDLLTGDAFTGASGPSFGNPFAEPHPPGPLAPAAAPAAAPALAAAAATAAPAAALQRPGSPVTIQTRSLDLFDDEGDAAGQACGPPAGQQHPDHHHQQQQQQQPYVHHHQQHNQHGAVPRRSPPLPPPVPAVMAGGGLPPHPHAVAVAMMATGQPVLVSGSMSSVTSSMDDELALHAQHHAHMHHAAAAMAHMHVTGGGAPAHMHLTGGGASGRVHLAGSGAAAPLAPPLRQRLAAAIASAQQHATLRCAACGVAPLSELAPALERLLAEVVGEHQAQLAAMEGAHKTEISDIKKMAVQRIKEVMGKQQQQQHQ